MQEEQRPHQRRKRYAGAYPRHFHEKYKELNPEKYQDHQEHVIAKGNTPAGTHIPIMVEEILDFLQIQKGQIGLDCTLGYGGHSSKMAALLQGQGHLYSLDLDPIEIEKTTQRLRNQGFTQDLWTPIHTSFANIDEVCRLHGPFDFLLADLGVSSMQIDDPLRGFTWKEDGPLDLRFDPMKGTPAAERLADITKEELEGMLVENADEPYAEQIASALIRERKKGRKLSTTGELREVIENTLDALPSAKHISAEETTELKKKTCARVFQALRIDVNNEYETLYDFLEKLPHVLKSGGRAAILTFHSGEDRLVKKAFRRDLKAGTYSAVSSEVIRPSRQECIRNPRAHSTKLRWAVKN